MKFPISGLIPILFFAVAFVEAKEPVRTFTDAEGREIKARIHNTDGHTVLLETEDGQGFKTTIEVFSLEDQEFIRNWEPSPPQEAEGPELDESEAEIREDIYYKIGEDLPHSGALVSKFVDDTPRATVALNYGTQHGPTTLWYDTGGKKMRAMYRNGAQHGLTTLWYPNGELKAESAYAYGAQHGLTTFWHPNGKKRSEGLWSQGQREGVHSKWHENGQTISQITYILGRPSGDGAAWYPDGQKKMTGTWANGVKNGLYSEWYPDGQQKMEVNYLDGVVTGKPLYWSSEGKKLKRKPKEAAPAMAADPTDPTNPEPPSQGPKILSARSGGEGYYVRFLGRISIPKDTIWSSTLVSTGDKFDQDVQLDGGLALGGAFGRDFGLYRAELESTFSTYQPTGITYQLPNGGYSQGSATGDIVQYTLLLNNAIDLEVTPNMEIFGGAGLGLAYTNLDLHRPSASSQNSSGVKFAYQILTGLKYNLSGYHNLTGGYKYLSNGDLGDFEGIKSHNFEFGYRLDM